MNKPVVFISHITEEAGLAKILQLYLKNAFLGMVDIFVSSDKQSIQVGERWYDRINESLQSAGLAMVLCSQASIRRPWINFEAGALHIREIPVIPVCHSNLSLNDLPSPLNTLQGVVANEQSGLEQIIKRIADLLGAETPQIDFRAYAREIQTFEQSNINQTDAPQVNNSAEIAKIQSEVSSYKTRLDKAQSDIKKLKAEAQDSANREESLSNRLNELQSELDCAKTKIMETERFYRLSSRADQVLSTHAYFMLGEDSPRSYLSILHEAKTKAQGRNILQGLFFAMRGHQATDEKTQTLETLSGINRVMQTEGNLNTLYLTDFLELDEERQGKLLEIVEQMVECLPENQE